MIKGRCLCEEVCFTVDPEGIVRFNNDCLEGQGSAEFWEAFMARKQSSSPD